MKILFICTHNRCRSILGEAITRKLCGDNIQVKSAGSAPASNVHPETLKNLERHNYDTQGLVSNSWDDLGGFIPDISITVCDNAAKEVCPLWLGESIKIHWGLPDPTHNDISENKKQDAFDHVIATLEKRIKKICQIDFENSSETEIKNIFNQIGDTV